MHDSVVSKKLFFWCVILSVLIVFVIFVRSLTYNTTRIVFCDVGQGDGIYIRTVNDIDILIDAGPNRSILRCIGKYMPFYDRTIELAFLTHPQIDHYGGFLYVLERYNITTFLAPPVHNDNKTYNRLKNMIISGGVKVINPYAGQRIKLGKDNEIRMQWPSRAFAEKSATKNVLGAYTDSGDLNAYSQIFLYKEGAFETLFTGDATPDVLDSLTGKGFFMTKNGIEVLKVPHHGSRNGMTERFLSEINPDVSILSFGAKNRYGHPSSEILKMLDASRSEYLSTAEHGDIVVEINRGGAWRIAGASVLQFQKKIQTRKDNE